MPKNTIKLYKARLNPYGWLMRISLILCGLSIIACLAHLIPMLMGSVSLIPIIWPLLLTGTITWTVSLAFLSASFIIRQVLFSQYFDWLSQYPKQLSIGFYVMATLSGSTFLVWCLSKLIFHQSISGIILSIGWAVPLTLLVYSIFIKITQKTMQNIDKDSELITTAVGNDSVSFRAHIIHKTSENQCQTQYNTIKQKDLPEMIKKSSIKNIYLYFPGKDEKLSKKLFLARKDVMEDNSLFIAVIYEESLSSLLLGRAYHEKAIQTYQAAHSFASRLLTKENGKDNYDIKYWLHAGYNQLSSFFLKKNKVNHSNGKKGLSYYLFKLFFYDLGSKGTLDTTAAIITSTGTDDFLQSDEVIPNCAELADTIALRTGGHNNLSIIDQIKVKDWLSGHDNPNLAICGFSNGVAVIREGENHIPHPNKT